MYEFTRDCMLNIEEIDNEHRRLFQMINEAVAMIEQSDDVTYIANSLISNLKEYASTHFAHEEAYMESIHDPELPLQKKEHKAFTEKVNQFAIDTSSPGAARSSLGEFITFLVRWLYRHILSSDMMIGKMPPATGTYNDNFAFTDIYKTGIALIDDEHQRLFEIVGETNDLIHDDMIPDKYDKIMNLLTQLREYTEFHFHDEESLMERIKYPELDSQLRAHSAFINRIVEIKVSDLDDMDDNQQEYLINLINFLSGWLINHILGSDKKIGEYMRQNNISE